MEVDTEPAARSAIESKNEVDEVDSGHREEKVTEETTTRHESCSEQDLEIDLPSTEQAEDDIEEETSTAPTAENFLEKLMTQQTENTPEKQEFPATTTNDLSKALAESFMNVSKNSTMTDETETAANCCDHSHTNSPDSKTTLQNSNANAIAQLLQQLQKGQENQNLENQNLENPQNLPNLPNFDQTLNPASADTKIDFDFLKSDLMKTLDPDLLKSLNPSDLKAHLELSQLELNQFGIDTSTMATHGRATILDKDGVPVNSDHQVSCRICGEFFADLNELRNHEHTKHANIPVYTCKVCKYCSLEKSLMIRHLRTHIGLRPFFCKQCGYAFTTKANCERHLRKRHNMMGRADLEQSIRCDSSQMKKVPADSMYVGPDTVCMHCDQKFQDYWSLRDHMRIHDKKNYFCLVCAAAFSSRSNCVSHIMNKHESINREKANTLVRFEPPPPEVGTATKKITRTRENVQVDVLPGTVPVSNPNQHNADIKPPTNPKTRKRKPPVIMRLADMPNMHHSTSEMDSGSLGGVFSGAGDLQSQLQALLSGSVNGSNANLNILENAINVCTPIPNVTQNININQNLDQSSGQNISQISKNLGQNLVQNLGQNLGQNFGQTSQNTTQKVKTEYLQSEYKIQNLNQTTAQNNQNLNQILGRNNQINSSILEKVQQAFKMSQQHLSQPEPETTTSNNFQNNPFAQNMLLQNAINQNQIAQTALAQNAFNQNASIKLAQNSLNALTNNQSSIQGTVVKQEFFSSPVNRNLSQSSAIQSPVNNGASSSLSSPHHGQTQQNSPKSQISQNGQKTTALQFTCKLCDEVFFDTKQQALLHVFTNHQDLVKSDVNAAQQLIKETIKMKPSANSAENESTEGMNNEKIQTAISKMKANVTFPGDWARQNLVTTTQVKAFQEAEGVYYKGLVKRYMDIYKTEENRILSGEGSTNDSNDTGAAVDGSCVSSKIEQSSGSASSLLLAQLLDSTKQNNQALIRPGSDSGNGNSALFDILKKLDNNDESSPASAKRLKLSETANLCNDNQVSNSVLSVLENLQNQSNLQHQNPHNNPNIPAMQFLTNLNNSCANNSNTSVLNMLMQQQTKTQRGSPRLALSPNVDQKEEMQ